MLHEQMSEEEALFSNFVEDPFYDQCLQSRKKYLCRNCSKCYKSSDSVLKHWKRKHTDSYTVITGVVKSFCVVVHLCYPVEDDLSVYVQ